MLLIRVRMRLPDQCAQDSRQGVAGARIIRTAEGSSVARSAALRFEARDNVALLIRPIDLEARERVKERQHQATEDNAITLYVGTTTFGTEQVLPFRPLISFSTAHAG